MDDLLNTPWVLEVSDDTFDKIDTLDVTSENAWRDLRSILQRKLTPKSQNRLWKKLSQIDDVVIKHLRLSTIKLVFTGAATFDHITKNLWVSCLRNNVFLKTMSTDFDQVAQIAFSKDEKIEKFNPDIMFLYQDVRNISDILESGDVNQITSQIEQSAAFARKFQQNYGAVTMFNTLATPIDGYQADSDLTYNLSLRTNIAIYNKKLCLAVDGTGNFIFDIEQLASMVGISKWGKTDYWHLAKMPFAPSCILVFSERFASLIAAFAGKSRRVLVLDCDNTLWGGVIGDDGIDGIKIGQGTAQGEAFLDIHRAAMTLRSRGIVLAVSSKNTEDVALNVFKNHPDMLLREKDISVFRVNWIDKAANIEDIAKTLDLGLQSFVFLDDNPAERERVRQALPEVAVPEVGDNPADYPAFLMQAGYFNTTFFSQEDSKRADMYSANAKRNETLNALGDMDAYLKSLNMKIAMNRFDEIGRPRIVQLISKSNQFNLTTLRLSNAEVEQVERDDDSYHLQVRLTDKFGDNGMISVVVANKSEKTWNIILWLMSCRVLGRRVEEKVLSKIVEDAKSDGAEFLIGEYIPSDRNGIVSEHYKKLGFVFDKTDESGKQLWKLDLASYKPHDLAFEVI